MKTRWLLPLGVSALLGCGEVPGDSGAPPSTAVTSPLDFSQSIPVRFVSVAGATCAAVTSSQISGELNLINTAGAPNGLHFSLYRADYYPLRTDGMNDVMSAADLAPVWDPLGLSSAIRDNIDSVISKANPPSLFRWLSRTAQKGMPQEVVAWQGCRGGVETTNGGFYNTDTGNFVHEMGHGFGLSHSFGVAADCNSWDLIYAARGKGKANFFFKSHLDCNAFAAADAGTFTFYRLDPKDPAPKGKLGVWANNTLTLSLPRCAGCSGADVETYKTGDWEIAGFSRYVDALGSSGVLLIGALNAMTYWGQRDVSASWQIDKAPIQVQYSASQIELQKAFVNDNPWMFTQGHPVAVNPPRRSCGYLFPNEGLLRDQPYYSCDGRFLLYLQADGNLVFSQPAANKVIWATGPLVAGTDTTDIKLLMRDDGNLVVYDAAQNPLWSSHTQGNPGAYVALSSNNGDMKIRTADGSSFIWKAGN